MSLPSTDQQRDWDLCAAEYGPVLLELVAFHRGDLEGALSELLSRVPQSVVDELLDPL